MSSPALSEEEISLERGTKGLGFNIKGGIDQPHLPGNPGVFVTKLREDGAAFADGRLKKGDRILKINGEDVTSVPHKNAVDLFVNAGETVKLLVQHGAEAEIKAQHAEESQTPSDPSEGGRQDGSYWPVMLIGAAVVVGITYFLYTRKIKN